MASHPYLPIAGLWLLIGLVPHWSHDPAGEVLPKPLPAVVHPKDNPSTLAKVALGKMLFFDPRLSSTKKVSCASCHIPKYGFSNGQRFGTGVKGLRTARNVPTLYNVAYSPLLFWDGRARSLEEQALMPIQHPKEMAMSLEALVNRLNKVEAYRKKFQDVFGGSVTASRIAQALAAYERSILSHNTPFDRYLRGSPKALSPSALRGMKLFYGQARCFVCHSGSNLTDHRFHNVGFSEAKSGDNGRRAITRREADQGKFRTPSLREVGRTAPYGHNGRFQTLEEVVQHYNFGGVTEEANDYRDEELQVLYLSEDQVADLVTFLKQGLTTPTKE